MSDIDTKNTFKQRWKTMMDNPEIIHLSQESHAQREERHNGFFQYLLDAFCLPFHVFLRGNMGSSYVSYFKIVTSSLFFLFCMMMIQFRFETTLHFSPFTPGGFRFVPDIQLPPSIPAFFTNLAAAWNLWTDSFTLKLYKLWQNLGSSSLIFKSIALYNLCANARWLFGKFSDRLEDRINHHSSGESKLFGIIPIWNWLFIYNLGYLLNFKTDIVKQYAEPFLLFIIAQPLLLEGNDKAYVFLGICCYFGSGFTALQAYLRSLPERRENDAMLRAKFRAEARDTQMEIFNMYAQGSPTVRTKKGIVTRISK